MGGKSGCLLSLGFRSAFEKVDVFKGHFFYIVLKQVYGKTLVTLIKLPMELQFNNHPFPINRSVAMVVHLHLGL
jgi:hypothetical protein